MGRCRYILGPRPLAKVQILTGETENSETAKNHKIVVFSHSEVISEMK